MGLRMRGKKVKVKALTKAKKQAKKPVDINQNKAIIALTNRIKKLEHTTVERKYNTSYDAFNFGGLGAVKSRMIHRYNTGTYRGMTTTQLFGTTPPNGDLVFARYMIVDVEVQAQNPNPLIGDENNPTTFTMWVLKARKEQDFWNSSGAFALTDTNGLNSGEIISQPNPGQSFVNPKGWKIVKQRRGVIGGVNNEAGYGIAHRRYRFKIPLNKKISLQGAQTTDQVLEFPTEVQDWYWFAICANGSVSDGNEPHCSLSVMLCYDDAGDN